MDPLKVFIIYSHEDASAREDLVKFLHHLENKGKIEVWTDKEILPGELWDNSIKLNLNEADIILPLVSVDFYNSNYIRDVEFKTAKERRDKGEALLIPVLVKECPWKSYELISDLQVLPSDARSVEEWESKNRAYTHIAETIEDMADRLRINRVEAERLELQKKQREAEERLRQESRKTEEAKRAREEAMKQHQLAEQKVEEERLAKEQAQIETKNERAERLKLKEAILEIKKQRQKGRYLTIGMAVLGISSVIFAWSTFRTSEKRKTEYDEMTVKIGVERAVQQGKVDSIRNLVDDMKRLKGEQKDLIIAIHQRALDMYKEDEARYRDTKKNMQRAREFLNAMGYHCKDDVEYIENVIANPAIVEKK